MNDDEATGYLTLDQLVGSNITALRTTAGLSLREAAVLMTIWHYESWTYQRIYRREQGTAPVTIAEMYAFADLFGVPVYRLLKRPRFAQFIQVNAKLVNAGDYENDYFFDAAGRTGEPDRIDPARRQEIIAEEVRKGAEDGRPFAPGLLDRVAFKTNLKSLAREIEPIADQIRQAARKGKNNGDDQED